MGHITQTKRFECHGCIHKRQVPGDAHIKCANPDPEMTGEKHGVNHGWFNYPECFDPAWKAKECCNFTKKGRE